MKPGTKTQSIGQRTGKNYSRISRLTVNNKHPEFDYSFRRKTDISGDAGSDQYGYVPVGPGNESGETWGGPGWAKTNTAGKAVVVDDVILCRRPKAVSKYYKDQEDDKYNDQIKQVAEFNRRASQSLRELDSGATVKAEIKGDFTQRQGPTEEQT